MKTLAQQWIDELGLQGAVHRAAHIAFTAEKQTRDRLRAAATVQRLYADWRKVTLVTVPESAWCPESYRQEAYRMLATKPESRAEYAQKRMRETEGHRWADCRRMVWAQYVG